VALARRRAAHFLLHPGLAGSPPNEALVSALLGLGLDVDVFAPGTTDELRQWGERVRLLPVSYDLRWLLRNGISTRWLRYSLVSGTSELPMGVAGIISQLYRIPTACLADEIRTGSYAGNAPARWKALARRGMRRARLTVVNDPSRIPLQRDLARLPASSPVLVYPSSFVQPPAAGDRAALRARLGIPVDAFVLAYSGVLHLHNGGLWIPDVLRRCPDVHVWLKTRGADPFVVGLFARVEGADRLHLDTTDVTWHEAWASAALADVGLALYLHDGPQFRHMGTSSNRVCMFLGMGVPVIATRQPSFEFLERYGCGVLVDGPEDVAGAVARIRAELPAFRANALRCWREHVAAERRFGELVHALAHVLDRRTLARAADVKELAS